MTAPQEAPPFDFARIDALLRRALVFNHIGDAMILTDASGTIADWNSGAEELFGWTREEAIGQTPAILHRPEDAPTLAPSIREVVVREGRWSGSIPMVSKGGALLTCELGAVPLVDHGGRVLGMLLVHSAQAQDAQAGAQPPAGTSADVGLASIPAAERTPEEERTLLRALLDALPDPIFVKDREGRYLLQNIANKTMLRADEGECIGRTVFDFSGLKEHAALYHADDMTVLSTGKPLLNREEPFQLPDGRKGWFLTSKFPFRDADGHIVGLIGIARDITHVKRATRELAETRQRLADHVENSPLAVVEWGPDFCVTRWTGQAEAMFGWSAQEVLGKHFDEFPLVHPDDLVRVGEVVARLLDGRDQRNICNNRNLTKSGRIIHCSWQNSVLHDSAGRTVSIVSLVLDVTDRVVAEQAGRKAEADRQALERKLQEAQKLESLGVLAGGIAHDFNNLLTGVLGNASLARMDLPEESPIQLYLEQIETAATRAADLCRQMLAYSGKGRFVIQRLDLNKVIDETAKLLHVSISKKAVIKIDLAPGLPAVLGDATQLRQIIMNLVINASEAVGDRSGFIGVTTGLMRADRAYLQSTLLAPELPGGDYVFLEVSDNGGGMSPEVQHKIFEPFFTTKFTGRGLGLAAVLGIVRGHKGALKVFSEPGWGTTFKVLLPCAEGPADAIAASPQSSASWRGEGTVLVVDDEETVRVTTARMLEACGFETVLADNGRTGVERFRTEPGQIALVVLDLTMPHMDGEEAFKAIVETRPDARVLLMSGFNEQEAIARFTGKGLAGFIQKPFTLPALREKLQEILK